MCSRLAWLLALAVCLTAQQGGRDVLQRGLNAFSAGRFADAESYLRQAVAAEPGSFDARLALGATLAELSRPGDAIEHLAEAHRLRPGHRDALKLLASQLMAARLYPRAIALLAPLAAPDEEVTLLLIESYQASGDTASSFAMARKAALRFPSSAPVKCWLGFQLQFSGRYEEARRYLEEALRLAPDYPAVYSILADVLLKQRKNRESIPYFEKAIELNPEDTDARIGLSHAWTGVGDFSKALQTLREAVAAAPADARVHLQLSRICFRMGDEACAQRESDLSLQLRNEKPGVGELPTGLRSGR